MFHRHPVPLCLFLGLSGTASLPPSPQIRLEAQKRKQTFLSLPFSASKSSNPTDFITKASVSHPFPTAFVYTPSPFTLTITVAFLPCLAPLPSGCQRNAHQSESHGPVVLSGMDHKAQPDLGSAQLYSLISCLSTACLSNVNHTCSSFRRPHLIHTSLPPEPPPLVCPYPWSI